MSDIENKVTIPPGTYRAKAFEGEVGFTGGDKPQVGVAFVLLDGEHAGKRITWYGFFTPDTQDRTVEALRYCGWEGNDLSDLTGIDRNEVSLVIEIDTYNGVSRSKVAWVNRSGGVAMKNKMTEDQKRAFATQMMGVVVNVTQKMRVPQAGPGPARASGTMQRPAGGPPPAATGTDDDIPFIINMVDYGSWERP